MLSVILIVKNESLTLRRCLQSVSFADEIIVLDSGSTDSTCQIAREFTSKVYSADWKGYGIQKDRALAYAKGDWVLNVDADESVDERLQQAITEAISSDKADAYRIPIQMVFYGKPMRYSYSPSRHVRLFRREGARYSRDIVHEKVLLPEHARIAKMTCPIAHHSFQDVSHVLMKINRYSSYTAQVRNNQGHQTSLFKTCAASTWMFFRTYCLQRGFLDGREGFLLALFKAQDSFYRGVKQLYPDSESREDRV